MSTVHIPRLDLDAYVNGTAAQKKHFSDQIGEAFNQTGFVTITNEKQNSGKKCKSYNNEQTDGPTFNSHLHPFQTLVL